MRTQRLSVPCCSQCSPVPCPVWLIAAGALHSVTRIRHGSAACSVVVAVGVLAEQEVHMRCPCGRVRCANGAPRQPLLLPSASIIDSANGVLQFTERIYLGGPARLGWDLTVDMTSAQVSACNEAPAWPAVRVAPAQPAQRLLVPGFNSCRAGRRSGHGCWAASFTQRL